MSMLVYKFAYSASTARTNICSAALVAFGLRTESAGDERTSNGKCALAVLWPKLNCDYMPTVEFTRHHRITYL